MQECLLQRVNKCFVYSSFQLIGQWQSYCFPWEIFSCNINSTVSHFCFSFSCPIKLSGGQRKNNQNEWGRPASHLIKNIFTLGMKRYGDNWSHCGFLPKSVGIISPYFSTDTKLNKMCNYVLNKNTVLDIKCM